MEAYNGLHFVLQLHKRQKNKKGVVLDENSFNENEKHDGQFRSIGKITTAIFKSL